MARTELNKMSLSLLNYKKQKPMENIENNDQDQSKQGKQITDDNQKPAPQVEQSDSVIGDVHPTERSDTFQEQKNAETENQSDASEISGENL